MRIIDKNNYSIVEVSDTNRKALDNPKKFMIESEEYYNTQLSKATKAIATSVGKKLVLLSGPSGSGKTTTAHKLMKNLIQLGRDANVISMDDFFLGIVNYPILENGMPDMETVEAVDTDLLNKCLKELIFEGQSNFPIFDFKTQTRQLEKMPMFLNDNGVIIMEGIHALNPSIIKDIPIDNLFRLYLSVRTKFVNSGLDVLTPSRIRLLRRMVRDTLFRGYSIFSTIEYWENVLEGERKYINPYRDDVDFKMDNTLDYEVCVWHQLLTETLEHIDLEKSKNYPIMQEIVNALRQFESLPSDLIPEDSLLREFIG